jgi:hypothetical protein
MIMNTKMINNTVLGNFFSFQVKMSIVPKNSQTLKLSQKVQHEYFFEILTYVVQFICPYNILKNQLGIRALMGLS